jgi:hypothetical protein
VRQVFAWLTALLVIAATAVTCWWLFLPDDFGDRCPGESAIECDAEEWVFEVATVFAVVFLAVAGMLTVAIWRAVRARRGRRAD